MRFKVFLEQYEPLYRHPLKQRGVYSISLNREIRKMLNAYMSSWSEAHGKFNQPEDGDYYAITSNVVGNEKIHERLCRIFGYDSMFAKDTNSGLSLILTDTPESEFKMSTDSYVELTQQYGDWNAVEYIRDEDKIKELEARQSLEETFYASAKRTWKYFNDSQEGGPEFVHFTDYGKGPKMDAILRQDDKYTLELVDNKKTLSFNTADELVTYVERFLSLAKISKEDLAKLETVTESSRTSNIPKITDEIRKDINDYINSINVDTNVGNERLHDRLCRITGYDFVYYYDFGFGREWPGSSGVFFSHSSDENDDEEVVFVVPDSMEVKPYLGRYSPDGDGFVKIRGKTK